MAFDGLTINCLSKELNNRLEGLRINKIAQPEPYEILLTLKGKSRTEKLLISANASLPLLYLTQNNKQSPLTAPNFCMVLRKYLSNAVVTDISQVDFERVICISLSHLDDLGDEASKKIYIEIMGKHSNIIFCDGEDKIIDSIKHINASMSSVREVLPGRDYFIPTQEGKLNPMIITHDEFISLFEQPLSVKKCIYMSLTGISPLIATDICEIAGIDADISASALSDSDKETLYTSFCNDFSHINESDFLPNIIYDEDDNPIEYAPFELKCYEAMTIVEFDDISSVLETYYYDKNKITNIKQKTADIRKIVQTHLERNVKKLNIQNKQLSDSEKMDKYRIYGEMLQTYGYSIEPGSKKAVVNNYYTNEEITIPLDETKTAIENANKYFDKYNKLKRTKDALTIQIEETKNAIEHLQSIDASIMLCDSMSDLNAVKDELIKYGYIKPHYKRKKANYGKSKPIHYITEDGFHIYVGKNNLQNDEISFKLATGNDWWFHTKKIHGSHVIVKCENRELPDNIFEIAANLAAYYSQGKDSEKVEVDYIQKKHLKRVANAPAGFVIYHTNYSMMATPKIEGVELVK